MPSVLLTGCSLPFIGQMSGTGLSREEFAHYVEEVFRFQNRMTSEVMMLTAADDSANFSAVLKSEQQMQQACAPLNEYVARNIDGLSNGLALQRQVVKSALECDHAAHAVEVQLKR